VIKPFLLSQHIKSLDKVVISHSDLDHRGGLIGLRQWPMGEVLCSEPDRLAIPAVHCVAGQSWEWDGVQFTMLGPQSQAVKKRNDRSCVLSIQAGKQSILLTGDIEQSAEKTLMNVFPNQLTTSILVVPHHGSLTSSSVDFVNRVAPQYALYPVGLGNQYGFPKSSIVKRYEEVGSKNLVVSETGALIFQLNGEDELTPPTRWRDTSRHYWHRT
jgi:competence protein ComEC